MNVRLDTRATVLASFGANSDTTAELLSYDPGDLSARAILRDIRFPLDDEAFVNVWQEYSHQASESGFGALADQLVQLRFPIQEGISQSDEYRAATRRGASIQGMASATGLSLSQPQRCSIIIHPTWAGSVPIIQTGCREDFVSLLRAFTARNEPVPVPPSQGACIVDGYNNWDRVHRFQRCWMLDNPTGTFSLSLLSDLKDAYQDRFILLSDGWYSGVPPERLGLTGPEWQRLSLTIRRQHECAHYWTRRVLSLMNNRILDEIIADYCGIFAACGRLRADWALAFLGIDTSANCSEGGRMHNYRGNPKLSDQAFEVLARVVVAAIETLATFDHRYADELSGKHGLLLILLTLSQMSLEELASSDARTLLKRRLRRARTLAANAAATADVIH